MNLFRQMPTMAGVGEMSEDIWGRLASTYDADHACIAGADLVAAIQSRLAAAEPGGAVVELGCGTGLYTAVYASRCDHVIATDISPPMVDAARRSLATLSNVEVRLADAVATGLPQGSADVVVAVNLLHVVPHPAAVLAEARRLLRPGGVLLVAGATARGLRPRQMLGAVWHIVRRWGPRPPRAKGARDLDGTALEALIRTAGFESIEGQAIIGHAMNAAFVRALAPRTDADAV